MVCFGKPERRVDYEDTFRDTHRKFSRPSHVAAMITREFSLVITVDKV